MGRYNLGNDWRAIHSWEWSPWHSISIEASTGCALYLDKKRQRLRESAASEGGHHRKNHYDGWEHYETRLWRFLGGTL